MEKEDYKNEVEMLRQAFADAKTDDEIQMPDAEAELTAFMSTHKRHFEHKTLRLTFVRKVAALFLGVLLLSGFAYAAMRTSFFTRPWNGRPQTEPTVVADRTACHLMIIPNDTVQKPTGVITFDDQQLADILTSICQAYQVEIHFKNEEQKHIRLHFSYDTEEKLEEVMENLNTFEKFRLKLKNKKLIVE